MKLTQFPQAFLQAAPVLKTIEAAGYEAYFVGGAVRDVLLNHSIHDVDIATSAYPAEVKALFKRTVDTGIQHGTVTVLDHGTGYEITTFRTESGYQDYRRPDQVTFVRSLKEDLKRRDFTINALALRADGEIIDLFDGLSDLKHHVLRAVGVAAQRFHEDALRMMRAVRFEAQLNFTLEDKTKAAIAQNQGLLEKIALERIHSEFVKMMLADHWQIGLRDFLDTGLVDAVPGLQNQPQALSACLAYSGHLRSEAQVWTLLGWTLQLNVAAQKKMLKAWKTANAILNQSVLTLTLCQKLQAHQGDDWALYLAGQDAVGDALCVLALTGELTQAQCQKITERYANLPIHRSQDLAVNGGDLIQSGFAAGPKLGELLTALQQAVVLGQLSNDQNTLLQAAEKI